MLTPAKKLINCNANYETFRPVKHEDCESWQCEYEKIPLCIKVLELDWNECVGDYEYCIVAYVFPKKEADFKALMEHWTKENLSNIEIAEKFWSLVNSDWSLECYGKAIFRKNSKTGVVQNYVDLEFDDGDCSYPVKSDIEQFVADFKNN